MKVEQNTERHDRIVVTLGAKDIVDMLIKTGVVPSNIEANVQTLDDSEDAVVQINYKIITQLKDGEAK